MERRHALGASRLIVYNNRKTDLMASRRGQEICQMLGPLAGIQRPGGASQRAAGAGAQKQRLEAQESREGRLADPTASWIRGRRELSTEGEIARK